MKIKKINKEFLDLYYKNKLVAYELDEENGKVYLTDSYRMYIINYEDFIFRFDLFRNCSLKRLLNEDEYYDAELSDTFEKINGVMCKILYVKDKIIKVNSKYFDLFDNYTLKAKDETSPILVYENDELKGLVMPIKEY